MGKEFACPHRGKATTKKEYRIMNKECRMSKESLLINFIILHSLFLVRYSKIFSWKITNMKSWGKNFGLKMLYIRLFRDLQKNILPENGGILRLDPQNLFTEKIIYLTLSFDPVFLWLPFCYHSVTSKLQLVNATVI